MYLEWVPIKTLFPQEERLVDIVGGGDMITTIDGRYRATLAQMWDDISEEGKEENWKLVPILRVESMTKDRKTEFSCGAAPSESEANAGIMSLLNRYIKPLVAAIAARQDAS